MATIILPRLLGQATRNGLRQEVEGADLASALEGLFAREPSLKTHLLDETGSIRQHVLIFVNGRRAQLGSAIEPSSKIRILQAVSGGESGFVLCPGGSVENEPDGINANQQQNDPDDLIVDQHKGREAE